MSHVAVDDEDDGDAVAAAPSAAAVGECIGVPEGDTSPGPLESLNSSAQICSFISSAFGDSDKTQSSSMASWHTGQFEFCTFHCSMHGQQKLCAQDSNTSDFRSMQMMHSSSSGPVTASDAATLDAWSSVIARTVSIIIDVLQPLSSLRISAVMCISKVRKTERNCLRFSKRYCSIRLGCSWTLTQAIRTVAFQNSVVSVPFFNAKTNWCCDESMHFRELKKCVNCNWSCLIGIILKIHSQLIQFQNAFEEITKLQAAYLRERLAVLTKLMLDRVYGRVQRCGLSHCRFVGDFLKTATHNATCLLFTQFRCAFSLGYGEHEHFLRNKKSVFLEKFIHNIH